MNEDFKSLLDKYKKCMYILPAIIVLFVILFLAAYMAYAVNPCNASC